MPSSPSSAVPTTSYVHAPSSRPPFFAWCSPTPLLSHVQQVIPYRESKLTQAVRDFFIGQAKGRIIINISQAEEDFDETLPVLDFANTAKEVSTNMKRAGRVPATPSVPRLPAAGSVELGDARGLIE